MKALVAGWFSFEAMGATAGDLLTRDLVCDWLAQAGYEYDICLALPFTGGVDWQSVNPQAYAPVVFVCGPLGNGWPVSDFLARFAGQRLIGVNLSMLEPLETWNPFHLLLERDSSRTVRPDISFLSAQTKCAVVGVVLVHPQKEYAGGRHAAANAAITRLLDSREAARVNIDTRLDQNSTGLRTPSEVESLISRMDMVVTTRLHGLALAIKNGVPALAIDPIAGGAKIKLQAEAIGWPIAFTAESFSDEDLQKAFEYCLSEEARARAIQSRGRARAEVARTRDQFLAALDRERLEDLCVS